MFYQMFVKTDSSLPVKLLLETKPTEVDSLVKLSCTRQAHTVTFLAAANGVMTVPAATWILARKIEDRGHLTL